MFIALQRKKREWTLVSTKECSHEVNTYKQRPTIIGYVAASEAQRSN